MGTQNMGDIPGRDGRNQGRCLEKRPWKLSLQEAFQSTEWERLFQAQVVS